MRRFFTNQTIWLAASAPLALAGAVLPHGAALAADVTVCIDKTSPTADHDQALASDAAKKANLSIAFDRFDSSDDDEGMSPKAFQKLLATQCNIVMGFPIEDQGGAPPDGLGATHAYDQTGFVLATQNPLPSTGLNALPKGTAVAVTYGTVPNLYFPTHTALHSDIQLSEDATLKSLVSGEDKAALLWQPTITGYLAAHPGAPITFHALTEPHARWNIVALYAPRSAAVASKLEAQFPPAPGVRHGALMPPARPRIPFIQLAAATVTAPDAGPIPHAAIDPGAVSAPPPALYTDAQAKTGAQKFSDNCEQCHGAHLEGRSGPALKGPNFASAKAAFTVGDVFTFMSTSMPAQQPGSLQPDDYVQIMAFILQQNGYPAGQTAFNYDGGQKSKVPLLWRGK